MPILSLRGGAGEPRRHVPAAGVRLRCAAVAHRTPLGRSAQGLRKLFAGNFIGRSRGPHRIEFPRFILFSWMSRHSDSSAAMRL
jgi:hypothetical protein